MDFINQLEQFLQEYHELYNNYERALNLIQKYRIEKAGIINAIINNNIDTYKKLFISDNPEKQISYLTDWHNVEKDVKTNSCTGWFSNINDK